MLTQVIGARRLGGSNNVGQRLLRYRRLWYKLLHLSSLLALLSFGRHALCASGACEARRGAGNCLLDIFESDLSTIARQPISRETL